MKNVSSADSLLDFPDVDVPLQTSFKIPDATLSTLNNAPPTAIKTTMTKQVQIVNGNLVSCILHDILQFTRKIPHPQTKKMSRKMIIAINIPENPLATPSALFTSLDFELAANQMRIAT